MQIQEYNLFFYFITNKIECYAHSYQLLCCLTPGISGAHEPQMIGGSLIVRPLHAIVRCAFGGAGPSLRGVGDAHGGADDDETRTFCYLLL